MRITWRPVAMVVVLVLPMACGESGGAEVAGGVLPDADTAATVPTTTPPPPTTIAQSPCERSTTRFLADEAGGQRSLHDCLTLAEWRAAMNLVANPSVEPADVIDAVAGLCRAVEAGFGEIAICDEVAREVTPEPAITVPPSAPTAPDSPPPTPPPSSDPSRPPPLPPPTATVPPPVTLRPTVVLPGLTIASSSSCRTAALLSFRSITIRDQDYQALATIALGPNGQFRLTNSDGRGTCNWALQRTLPTRLAYVFEVGADTHTVSAGELRSMGWRVSFISSG